MGCAIDLGMEVVCFVFGIPSLQVSILTVTSFGGCWWLVIEHSDCENRVTRSLTLLVTLFCVGCRYSDCGALVLWLMIFVWFYYRVSWLVVH